MNKFLQPHILALLIIPGILISGFIPQLYWIGIGLCMIGGYNLGITVRRTKNW